MACRPSLPPPHPHLCPPRVRPISVTVIVEGSTSITTLVVAGVVPDPQAKFVRFVVAAVQENPDPLVQLFAALAKEQGVLEAEHLLKGVDNYHRKSVSTDRTPAAKVSSVLHGHVLEDGPGTVMRQLDPSLGWHRVVVALLFWSGLLPCSTYTCCGRTSPSWEVCLGQLRGS